MLICLGIIVASAIYNFVAQPASSLPIGRQAIITGTVTQDVVFKKSDYRLRLQVGNSLVYAMLEREPNVVRSDRITLEGVLEAGFGEYDAFLYHPKLISISKPSTPDFAVKLRDFVGARAREQINNDEATGLALSYLLGQKSSLSNDLNEKLRAVGLAHVVVASGFHLAIVVGFARKYFGKISRFATLAGAAIMMFCYISITGFSPSMMRAGLATFLSLLAWYFGRHFHPVRLIIYLIALTLMLDPGLLTNLAWQLSFASYAGILILSPLFSRFLYGDKKVPAVATIIIASVSAQLFCLPICVYNFGFISLVAIVTNLLISPLISITMLLTLITGLTNLAVFGMLTRWLLQLQLGIINFFANIPWCTYDFGETSRLAPLAYVVIIAIIIVFKRLTRYDYRPRYRLDKSPDYGKI